MTSLRSVTLRAPDSRFKLRRKLPLIFEKVVQPIAYVREFRFREFLKLSGKLFNLAHGRSMPERKAMFKSATIGTLRSLHISQKQKPSTLLQSAGF